MSTPACPRCSSAAGRTVAGPVHRGEPPRHQGRALDAGCVPVSALMDGSHVSAAAREILTRLGADVPVFTAEDAVLTQLTGFHLTRGMLCAMRRPALPEAGALCRAAGGSSCLKM